MSDPVDVDRLRAEIAATREELSRTVGELVDKADVKAQTSRKAHESVAAVTEGAHHAIERVKGAGAARSHRRQLLIGAGIALALFAFTRRNRR